MAAVLRGGCLCGAVQYEIPDALLYAAYCHCSQCRRFSGSALSAVGGIARDRLRFTAGEEQIRFYRKSEESHLAFCGNCGSSLFSDKRRKGLVHIRLGTLADCPSLRPQAHVFVGSKAPWYEITDELPRFEAAPPAG